MSDKPTGGQAWVAARVSISTALDAIAERRRGAQAELQAARDELCELLARGQAVALDVTAMARAARGSRDTAHHLLHDAGSRSWHQ